MTLQPQTTQAGARVAAAASAARHDAGGPTVPLRSNRPLQGVDPARRLRNFDVFDLAPNPKDAAAPATL